MTETDYGPGDVINALRRYWWLALMLPAIVGSLLTIRNLTADYQASFSATVLLPGDTEIPGSSERPELMILDDVGPVVRSEAFAAMVAAEAGVATDEITGTLDATRYSRVVTVTATGPDAATAEHTISAAATVFPAAVNEFMVADGGTPATVNIIDSPGEAQRGDADQWTILMIATLVSLAVGCFLALILDAALTTVRRSAHEHDAAKLTH